MTGQRARLVAGSKGVIEGFSNHCLSVNLKRG
ncbi:hypothetical protein N692_05535 [Lactiplantibacillus plantarum EGD-AQ4]|nr:hypothetical protein N692_05535 [Lactiplantibacillus plantarum EGD-AQ4]